MDQKRLRVERKMEKISRSARRLFVERGFHGVAIPDIVADSGVSTGSIYRYYGSKVGLAQKLYEESLEQFCELLTERLGDQVGAYSRLKTVADLLLTLAAEDSVIVEFLFLFRHQDFLDDYRPVLLNSFSWMLYQIVEEGIIDGELSPGDPLIKSVAYLGVLTNSIQAFLSGLFQSSDGGKLKEQVVQCAWNTVYQ